MPGSIDCAKPGSTQRRVKEDRATVEAFVDGQGVVVGKLKRMPAGVDACPVTACCTRIKRRRRGVEEGAGRNNVCLQHDR